MSFYLIKKMTLPVVLAGIALKLATDVALDYLYPDGVADGTLPTSPIPADNYTPPFTGGQMQGVQYKVFGTASRTTVDGSVIPMSMGLGSGVTVTGAVRGISVTYGSLLPNGGRSFTRVEILASPNVEIYFTSDTNVVRASATITRVERVGGGADTGGNLPNPNPELTPTIPNGGAPQNGTPSITNGDNLVEGGLPVLAVPPLLSLLAGLAAQLGSAIAAAQAAADALTAAKAIADAVKKLAEQLDAYKDLFEKLRVYLNQKEREEAAKKQYFIRQYGTILRDGYLDVTPRPAPLGFKPLMLDFRCANIPSGIGRFFGLNSYNWFRYQELGSICFLSPTGGVLSVHKIEHVRTSIAIPELAVGFTYNMGLNGTIRARVSMLYTQEKT